MSRNPGDSVAIAAVQMAPRLGQIEENLRQALERLERASREGARLVVFPECTLSGYVLESREEAAALAVRADGPELSRLTEACQRFDTALAIGVLLAEGSSLYNACVLLDGSGTRGVYRKTHMPFMGLDRFVDAGNEPFQVFEVAGLRVGPLVCYDGAFPEPARVLTLEGADLIILPTNWPAGAERLAEHTMACRALENVVYTLAASRLGTERGVRFIGGSGIYDPFGTTLAFAGPDQDVILTASIQPARARTKRIIRAPGTMEIDRIADRRPELYGRIGGPAR